MKRKPFEEDGRGKKSRKEVEREEGRGKKEGRE
jgi:hypothetical protein